MSVVTALHGPVTLTTLAEFVGSFAFAFPFAGIFDVCRRRQKCLDWDETIADALRKEFGGFGLVRHGNESLKESLERKLMKAFRFFS